MAPINPRQVAAATDSQTHLPDSHWENYTTSPSGYRRQQQERFWGNVSNSMGNLAAGAAMGALSGARPINRTSTQGNFKRQAADISDRQAARAQGDAQNRYQIANRNFRREGDMDAATTAASRFNQQMAQQSGASGTGAAVIASMNTADPTSYAQQHMQRGDQQFQRATALQTQAEGASAKANDYRSMGAEDDREYIEQQEYNNMLQGITAGINRPVGGGINLNFTRTQPPPPAEQPPSNTAVDDTPNEQQQAAIQRTNAALNAFKDPNSPYNKLQQAVVIGIQNNLQSAWIEAARSGNEQLYIDEVNRSNQQLAGLLNNIQPGLGNKYLNDGKWRASTKPGALTTAPATSKNYDPVTGAEIGARR